MKPNKSKKIILILIIVTVIILILAGLAYAILSTDLLGSNKKSFFKYAGKIFGEDDAFVSNQLISYIDKKKQNPIENEGQLTCSIDSNVNNDNDAYKLVNQSNLSFSGMINPSNNDFEQDVIMNYSEDVNFPFTIRKAGEFIGFRTDYVGSKYIAQSMSKSSEEYILPSIPNISLNQVEMKNIIDKYINIIDSNLTEEKFSKIENGETIGYKLTINVQDFSSILNAIYENLKNDEETLNKLNEMFSTEIDLQDLYEIIQDLDGAEQDENTENIEITLYVKNNELSKIEINMPGMKFEIEKNQENDNLKYAILLSADTFTGIRTITLNAEYMGLTNQEVVDENYDLKTELDSSNLEENSQETSNNETNNDTQNLNNEETNVPTKLSLEYKLSNKVTFVNNVNIEEFDNNNSVILDNYGEEEVDSFMQSVEDRIDDVNTKMMEQLGTSADTDILKYYDINYMFNLNDNETYQEDVSSYNSKYELYEGNNIRGATVRGLLTVISNNELKQQNGMSNNLKIEEINFGGQEYDVNEQNITFLKQDLQVDGTYRVEFERDEDTGAIYRVVINEN